MSTQTERKGSLIVMALMLLTLVAIALGSGLFSRHPEQVAPVDTAIVASLDSATSAADTLSAKPAHQKSRKRPEQRWKKVPPSPAHRNHLSEPLKNTDNQ